MALDSNGVHLYEETDLVSPWSDYMNLGQSSISDGIGDLDTRVSAVELGDDTGWVTLPLESGFEEWSASYPCSLRKIGKQVFMRGLVKRGSGLDWKADTLYVIAAVPSGYRPATASWFTSGTTGGQVTHTLVVYDSGVVQLRGSTGNSTYAGITATWLVD